MLAFRDGDQARAASAFEASLVLARASGDDRVVVLAMMGLARVDLRRRDLTAVRRRCEEALWLAEGLDPAARQHPLHLLATADRIEGGYAAAVERYRESLALNRRLGDERWVTIEMMNLAAAKRGLGRLDDAEAQLHEALTRALGGEGVISPHFVSLGSLGSPRSGGPGRWWARSMRGWRALPRS